MITYYPPHYLDDIKFGSRVLFFFVHAVLVFTVGNNLNLETKMTNTKTSDGERYLVHGDAFLPM